MSLLIKKSDIRNHLIVRRHERNRLYLPLPSRIHKLSRRPHRTRSKQIYWILLKISWVPRVHRSFDLIH